MSKSLDPDSGPVARGARGAAQRLSAGQEGSLVADVETALHARYGRRREQYLDPISVASLIVATASLTWTVYTDLRARRTNAAPREIIERVRIELADHGPMEPAERERIIDVVVSETIPREEED